MEKVPVGVAIFTQQRTVNESQCFHANLVESVLVSAQWVRPARAARLSHHASVHVLK